MTLRDINYIKNLAQNNQPLVARIAAVFLFALFITVQPIAAAEDEDPFRHLKEGVSEIQLENGLRALLYRRTNAPVFTGETWVRAGGIDEVPGQTGIAHFLEHMAFKGTSTIGAKNYDKEQVLLEKLEDLRAQAKRQEPVDAEELKRTQTELESLVVDNEYSRLYIERGAVGLNAQTSKDYTSYTVSLPSVAFEFWCWMESERLLNPVFRQFYKEREVVLEERRSRYNDDPSGKLYEALLSTAFVAHPNRLPVIGYDTDLRGLTARDMRQFYEEHYRPEKIVLSIVGDIDPAFAKTLIERYFGRFPKSSRANPPTITAEPRQEGERVFEVKFDAEPQLMLGYHKPTFPDRDDASFAILHSILSSGRTSMFYRELVQKKQVATAVGSSEAPGVLYPNIFYVSGIPSRGVSNDRLRDEIQSLFDRLKREKIGDSELSAAKRKVRVDFLKELSSNGGLAEHLGQTELLFGDWRSIFTVYDQILDTTAEDIQRLARTYLDVSNRSYVHLEKTNAK